MISRSWHFFPARGRGGRAVPAAQGSSLRRDFSTLVAHLYHTGIVQAYGSFWAPHMQTQGEIFRDSGPPSPPEARQHYAHRPPSAPTRHKRAPRATGTGTRAVGALGTRPSTLRRHSGAHARLAPSPPTPSTPPGRVPPARRGSRSRAGGHEGGSKEGGRGGTGDGGGGGGVGRDARGGGGSGGGWSGG